MLCVVENLAKHFDTRVLLGSFLNNKNGQDGSAYG